MQRSNKGILRNKSAGSNSKGRSYTRYEPYHFADPEHQTIAANLPNYIHHSPLRSKSRHSSASRHEPIGISASPLRESPVRHYNELDYKSKPVMRQSNLELREQYFRQINMVKKGGLNSYESAVLVGYFLDLIYMSRKLEHLKLKVQSSCAYYNCLDAFRQLEPLSYTPNPGQLS